MKKMITLLLALVMLAGLMSFASADDVTGEWYLRTMSQGDQSIDVAEMGMSCVMTLNADGSATFVGMGQDATGNWVESNGKYTITFEGDPADGVLSNGELTVSAGETSMVFTKEAVSSTEIAEVKADAAAEEFNGEWKCTALSAQGQTITAATAEAIGQELPTMTFKDGQFSLAGGDIAEAFGSFSLPLSYNNGTYSMEMSAGGQTVSIKANILQDGTMSLFFNVSDQEVGIYFAKVN